MKFYVESCKLFNISELVRQFSHILRSDNKIKTPFTISRNKFQVITPCLSKQISTKECIITSKCYERPLKLKGFLLCVYIFFIFWQLMLAFCTYLALL